MLAMMIVPTASQATSGSDSVAARTSATLPRTRGRWEADEGEQAEAEDPGEHLLPAQQVRQPDEVGGAVGLLDCSEASSSAPMVRMWWTR